MLRLLIAKVLTLRQLLTAAVRETMSITAWRIEGTLREFPKFKPVNTWFRYPIHTEDVTGILEDIQPEIELTGYQKMIDTRKKKAEKKKEDTINQIEVAFEGVQKDGVAAAIDIAEQIGVTADTLKRWFGKSRKARADYKKRFETFENPEDHKLYLRRKE